MNAFNSLYGIQEMPGYSVKISFVHFQFPLWDTISASDNVLDFFTFNSLYGIPRFGSIPIVAEYFKLSIPFMGYNNFRRARAIGSCSLSIPFMGYDLGCEHISSVFIPSFQFPLWDTAAIPIAIQTQVGTALSIPFMGY